MFPGFFFSNFKSRNCFKKHLKKFKEKYIKHVQAKNQSTILFDLIHRNDRNTLLKSSDTFKTSIVPVCCKNRL